MQIPQLLIAVFLVVVSALVAVVVFSRAAAREPVLALAQPVERGQVISSGDLMVVYVATDDPITTLSSEAASGLVGLTAVTDLEAGTILTPAHFVSRSLLDAGEGVVGLALAPGEYPTPLLAPGDLVDVVVTDSGSLEPGVTNAEVLVASAEVFDIAELGTQGVRFISLRMPAQETAGVAGAAAAGGVRLVLVADSGVDR
ncbi:MAG TPA: SAF domain-containing protein [Acidimicrobiia bacterium]|nr:SAF domain-containing protein [Acidimicrobiia bacterium]